MIVNLNNSTVMT